MSDLNIKCAKTGMLANAAVIRAVAQVLNNYKDIPLVIGEGL